MMMAARPFGPIRRDGRAQSTSGRFVAFRPTTAAKGLAYGGEVGGPGGP